MKEPQTAAAGSQPNLKSFAAMTAYQYVRKNPFRFQTLFIAGLLFLWEGLPFTFLGMSNVIGYQLYAVIVFGTSLINFVRGLINRSRITYWSVLPLAFFVYACFCSFVYSVLTKPQPPQAWMIAVYTIAPLLTVFSLRSIRATTGDCINGLLITGFIGSALVIAVQFSDSHLLDFYIRGSAFGSERRVVFFKLEAAFAAAIACIMMMNYSSLGKYILHGLILLVSAYNLFFLTESRLAMLAFFGAFGLAWLFLFRAKRKIIALSLAPIALIPLAFYFIDRFLGKFETLDKYLASDSSAKWRVVTINEFSRYFDTTHGLGFGFMSGNPQYDNVIAHTSVYGGIPYGLPNYGLYLDDIGIYSALYQYGYVGLTFVLVMTLLCVFRLGSAYKISRAYEPVCASGFMMFAFLLSPVSMNYFTLFYAAHIGGLLWFMASRVDDERRLIRASYFKRFNGAS